MPKGILLSASAAAGANARSAKGSDDGRSSDTGGQAGAATALRIGLHGRVAGRTVQGPGHGGRFGVITARDRGMALLEECQAGLDRFTASATEPLDFAYTAAIALAPSPKREVAAPTEAAAAVLQAGNEVLRATSVDADEQRLRYLQERISQLDKREAELDAQEEASRRYWEALVSQAPWATS